uniref:Uncharacterized protein n=1 Tax=Arundo donax TaxID=35708 RepID=A0A0A9E188_ARUDO
MRDPLTSMPVPRASERRCLRVDLRLAVTCCCKNWVSKKS